MTFSFTSHTYPHNVDVNTLRGIYYGIGFLFSFICFEAGTQNVEIDLELTILLPPPSECWNPRCV